MDESCVWIKPTAFSDREVWMLMKESTDVMVLVSTVAVRWDIQSATGIDVFLGTY